MWPELRWAPHPAPTTAPPGTNTSPTDWESKGTNFLQPSYHSPVLNHQKMLKRGTVKPYESTSHYNWIPHTPEPVQLALPHQVQAIGDTVSVVFMQCCTLPFTAGIQDLGIKGRRCGKQATHCSRRWQQTETLSVLTERLLFRTAKIKDPFSLVLNTSFPWHPLQKHKPGSAQEK